MNENGQQRISVTGPGGEKATLTAHLNPSRSLNETGESKLIYAIDGLIVEQLSSIQFKDFRGQIWTVSG